MRIVEVIRWELIPQPKGGYEATGWVAAAIGDAIFEDEDSVFIQLAKK